MRRQRVIYRIICLPNNRSYIGKAVNFKYRLNNHFKLLNSGDHHNKDLQRAFNQYGENSFRGEIIEFVTPQKDILYRERYHINRFPKPFNRVVPKLGKARPPKQARHEFQSRPGAKDSARYKRVVSAIKENGYSVIGFCNTVLKMPYKNFNYQLKNDVVRSCDIDKILLATNRSFEELFIEGGDDE